jgi:hypothetical protein
VAGNIFPRACAQSVSSNQYEVTGFLDLDRKDAETPSTQSVVVIPAASTAEDLDVFTLLSFQRPVLL